MITSRIERRAEARLLLRRIRRVPWLWILGAATICILISYWTFAGLRRETRDVSTARAKSFAISLAKSVDRSALIAKLIARDDRVISLLKVPPSSDDTRALNTRMSQRAAETGTEVLYVLGPDGTAVASSNWDQADSFVGKNFAFRPYFQSAVDGKPGRYIAVGRVSGRLGYYLSYPVMIDGRLAGVVVAKLGLKMLEHDWVETSDIMLVVDETGVILLTNRPHWRFQTLLPLSAAERTAIGASHRYSGQGLAALPITISGDTVTVTGGEDAGHYDVSTVPLPSSRNRVYVLSSVAAMWTRALMAGAVALGAMTIIAFASHLYLERQRVRVRLRLEYEAQMRDILERSVSERTADLQRTNVRLRETQGELIQAAKLAALGQMSASLAHELSQPVAAIRGFAENGVVLLERGALEDVNANLGEVVALTERIRRITRHLKAFARRAAQDIGPVPLAPAVTQSLSLMSARLRELGVAVSVEVAPDLEVMAEEVRLEQIMINLLQNACDAVGESARREVFIAARRWDGDVEVSIRDTGPGIAREVLPRLFDSFFTTKPLGHGLGLGLSITRDLVLEFGGRIEGRNAEQGGAMFLVWLPCAHEPDTVHAGSDHR